MTVDVSHSEWHSDMCRTWLDHDVSTADLIIWASRTCASTVTAASLPSQVAVDQCCCSSGGSVVCRSGDELQTGCDPDIGHGSSLNCCCLSSAQVPYLATCSYRNTTLLLLLKCFYVYVTGLWHCLVLGNASFQCSCVVIVFQVCS